MREEADIDKTIRAESTTATNPTSIISEANLDIAKMGKERQ